VGLAAAVPRDNKGPDHMALRGCSSPESLQ